MTLSGKGRFWSLWRGIDNDPFGALGGCLVRDVARCALPTKWL
jgi:hypothetical protein